MLALREFHDSQEPCLFSVCYVDLTKQFEIIRVHVIRGGRIKRTWILVYSFIHTVELRIGKGYNGRAARER